VESFARRCECEDQCLSKGNVLCFWVFHISSRCVSQVFLSVQIMPTHSTGSTRLSSGKLVGCGSMCSLDAVRWSRCAFLEGGQRIEFFATEEKENVIVIVVVDSLSEEWTSSYVDCNIPIKETPNISLYEIR
jgi:hypothetical protein